MFELLPEGARNQLGGYELALLFLSAYLHDIGMNPPKAVVDEHRAYILTGVSTALGEAATEELRHWLDVHYPDIALSNGLTEEELERREEALAYYVRHKHNDWSEDWIVENLKPLAVGLYAGWLDDLVVLCRSHHDGLAELRLSRFDARLVGSPGQAMNLRYLAAVLRLADVIEFDPERTPEIIFRHRAVPNSSQIYWYKDHPISFTIDLAKRNLIFAATTPNAAIHKAVLETAEWVDRELTCCNVLASENAFHIGTIPLANRDYSWPWPSLLTRDIRESPGRFKYIEGAFRPNTGKVLELLGGTDLYGQRLAAIREILQNAADAVEEQLLWQLHAYSVDRSDVSARTTSLAEFHKIELELICQDKRIWLQCADSGVGMDAETLEQTFLKNGARTRPNLVRLQRIAMKRGLEYRRTGQFGIGVLSYFMIGDKLELSSRRSAESSGQTSGDALQFEIDGLHEFGQLSPSSSPTRGTVLRIRLRKDWLVEGDPEQLLETVAAQIAGYLRDTIGYAPCRISLRVGPSGSTHEIANKRGWVRDEAAVLSEHIEETRPTVPSGSDWKTEVQLQEQKAFVEILDEVNAANERARRAVCMSYDGLIAGSARARFWLPYYQYNDGCSLIRWTRLRDVVLQATEYSNPVAGYLDKGRVINSWKGFSVQVDLQISATDRIGEVSVEPKRDWRVSPYWHGMPRLSEMPVVVELDWSAGGRVALHRERLLLDKALVAKARAEIDELAGDMIRAFLLKHKASPLHWFDQKALSFLGVLDESKPVVDCADLSLPFHVLDKDTRSGLFATFRLSTAAFPTVVREADDGELAHTYRWLKRPKHNVNVSAALSLSADGRKSALSPALEGIPEIIVQNPPAQEKAHLMPKLIACWHLQPTPNIKRISKNVSSQRLHDKNATLVFRVGSKIILNEGSVLEDSFDSALWEKLQEDRSSLKWQDGSWIEQVVLASPKSAVTYLVDQVVMEPRSHWKIIANRHPNLVKRVVSEANIGDTIIGVSVTRAKSTSLSDAWIYTEKRAIDGYCWIHDNRVDIVERDFKNSILSFPTSNLRAIERAQ